MILHFSETSLRRWKKTTDTAETANIGQNGETPRPVEPRVQMVGPLIEEEVESGVIKSLEKENKKLPAKARQRSTARGKLISEKMSPPMARQRSNARGKLTSEMKSESFVPVAICSY